MFGRTFILRRSSCKGYFYACLILSSTTGINFILGLPVQEDNINHEGKYLYFDYIYNISGNPFIIDYSLIEKKLSKYIKDFEIIQTKNDGDIIGFPKSNLDNICAVLHNEQNLDIKSIHELFFSN